MSTHSLKEEYELCRVGNRSHEHFKLKVDDTYVYNSSQVVSACLFETRDYLLRQASGWSGGVFNDKLSLKLKPDCSHFIYPVILN